MNQRIIKFRVLPFSTGIWSIYELGDFGNDTSEYEYICQFTGLLDKDAKEIFEGDIVENNDIVWVIYYAEGAWKMAENGKRTSNDHLFLLEPEYSKVIGNIYEHPELLK